uniref:Uncharacterized protein n=1 Tax=Agaricus bisporus TaxID=5341 RepID=A0A1Q1M953_AGABI|nr:hypothetical protein [Agaricus bisporus]
MSRYVSIAEAKRTIAYTMLRSLGLTQFYTQSIIDSTLSPFLTMACLVFLACYEKIGLPKSGGLPGTLVDDITLGRGIKKEIRYFIPPVDNSAVFFDHWLDVLLTCFSGEKFSTPMTVGGTIAPPLDVEIGEAFYASSNIPELSLLEDLEYVRRSLIMHERIFDAETVRALKVEMTLSRKGLDMDPLYVEYVVIRTNPFWHSLMYHYYDNDLQSDLDACTVVSSLGL